MCDFSLSAVKSRPAKVGDKLTTRSFGTGTRGFASVDDCDTAVCVLPGTELVFDEPIHYQSKNDVRTHCTAIFRQIHKEQKMMHHDCLELPSGEQMLLTYLEEGQKATVLQLPAVPKTKQEAEEQTRLEVVG
jgi:hypothetical protein